MKQLLLILTIWNLGSNYCFSQQMDTFLLKDFEVKGIADQRNLGITKVNLNTGRFNTLTDVLQGQSALFVKQYGTGVLATTSMRGMGAQHTAVMWNGIYINSCMNSNLDLNLIPLFMLDNASVETGANAAACGNGAIAGAINLSNRVEEVNQAFGNLQTGSFGYYQAGAGATYNIKKVRFKTRILYRSAENDILFYNRFIAGRPLERQKNSAYVQKGFLQEMDYRINDFNQLKSSVWYLESKRELPAAMGVVNFAKEQQYDMNTRVMVNHRYKKIEKLVVNNKLAVLYDQLNYYNAYYPTSFNISKTLIAESEWLLRINRFNRVTNSVNNNYSTAKADGYLNWPARNMLSWWFKYEWQNRKEKLIMSLGSRLLYINNQFAPFSPDLAFQFSPYRAIKIKGNAAYSYRLPSFNDYFWQQGGNRDLLPERGFKQELSLEVKVKDLKFVGTGFHHVVNNWIMWLPVAGGNGWQAQNARQVSSAGFEVSADYTKVSGHHAIQIFCRYQYVKSINTKVYAGEESGLNKQLTYTPYHTGVATINYKFKRLFFNITEQFTGARYRTTDNLPAYTMPYYLLTNSTIGCNLGGKKREASLSFTANNVFNAIYQTIENMPTPLRNYQFTLKFNIINEK